MIRYVQGNSEVQIFELELFFDDSSEPLIAEAFYLNEIHSR